MNDVLKVSGRVTDADVLEGKASDCYRCPVALAILREVERLPGFEYTEVGSNTATVVFENDVMYFAYLPYRVAEWILGFDSGLPMLPFAFDLELEMLD